MSLDFNDAPEQQSMEVIPAGTVVPLAMKIRPGGTGDGGWYVQSKSSAAQYLDCEFIVTAGPFAKRKIWQTFVMAGDGSDGHTKAINISRATLRAIIESARGIDPKDQSPNAVQARRIAGWDAFQGLTFVAKLSIQKSKDYPDKNQIQTVLTPGHKEYSPPPALDNQDWLTDSAPKAGGASPAPAWATGQGTAAPANPAPGWAGTPPAPQQTTGGQAGFAPAWSQPAQPAGQTPAAPANNVPAWAQ